MKSIASTFGRMFLLTLMLSAPLFLSALDPGKRLSQYVHKKWTSDELPQQVLSIGQNPEGYLWLGTSEGLLVFDGFQFSKYEIPSLPIGNADYSVSNIRTTADGTLWAVIGNQGFFRMRDGRAEWFDSRRGLSSNYIWTMIMDPDGNLWIGTETHGLNRLREGRFTVFTMNEGLADNFISALHMDSQGTLWVGTKKGLSRRRNGKVTTYSEGNGLLSNFITVLAEDRRGRLWIGTDKGLHVLEGDGITPWKNRRSLAGIYVTDILEDRDGCLWVGTRGGLNRIVNDEAASLTAHDGMSSDFVRTIFQDMEGSLWIGTSGGLDQLREGKLTTFSKKEGLSSEYSTCVHEDSRGGLWVGNGERGIDLVKDGIIRPITVQDGLVHNNVSAIWSGRDGSVWIGTFGGGVNRLKNNAFTLYNSASGLSNNFINAVYLDSRDDIWIGTEGGGINRIHADRVEWTSKIHQLPGIWISFFHEDRQGNLWIGSEDAGMLRYRDGRFEQFTQRDGLGEDNLTCIHEDSEGLLWVGTRRHGISLWRNGRFSSIAKKDGLYHDTVHHILEDDKQKFWISSPRGIFRVDRAELLAFAMGQAGAVRSTAFGKQDGMRNSQCVGHSMSSGCKDALGRLWFSTMDGAVMVDPRQIRGNARPPVVRIEKFIVDGHAYDDLKQKIEFPPGRRNFEFHYTASLLAIPEKAGFRYRLHGFDPDWIDPGNRRIAFYTAIKPGDYRFQVSARNEDGVWSETGASLYFRLRPFFYQSGWFMFICALLLVGFGFSIYVLRMKRLTKRHRELARLVRERTQQLEKEKEKLETVNRAKSEFLSFAAHDLRNPLHAITSYSSMIESEASASATIRQRAAKVMQAANRMVGLIDELMQSSVIESGEISFIPLPVNMGDLVQRIIQNSLTFAESKGQQLLPSIQPGVVTRGDMLLIQQACENLVTNAIKFSLSGKRIWISLAASADRLRFTVKDEGPGLSPEDRLKVFGRFQRLSARPTGGESSTGLGLFIAKQLVDLHQGRLLVESELGAGSTFIIELPLLA